MARRITCGACSHEYTALTEREALICQDCGADPRVVDDA